MQSNNPFLKTNASITSTASVPTTSYAPPPGPPPTTGPVNVSEGQDVPHPEQISPQTSVDRPYNTQPQWSSMNQLELPPSYESQTNVPLSSEKKSADGATSRRSLDPPSFPSQTYPVAPSGPLERSPGPSSLPSQGYYMAPNISSGGFPGPSQLQSTPGSSMDRASSSFKHRKPLDPPPPSFSRPVPPHLHPGAPGNYPGGPLAPFPPLHLYSKEKSLDGGFPILLPPCAFQPHPFSQRDIMEGDWARFLEDLQITGRLSGSEKIAATVIPIAMHIGLAGMLVSRAIKGRMKSKKNEPAGQLVDMWNDHFFHPRRLHVILARGNENLSGDVEGPAPDLREGRSRRSSSCSSSSSSSDDGTNSRHGRHAHRSSNPIAHIAEVRAERIDRIVERKERRREDRRGRREERRMRRAERRQTKHEKYRLVIVGL